MIFHNIILIYIFSQMQMLLFVWFFLYCYVEKNNSSLVGKSMENNHQFMDIGSQFCSFNKT